MTSNLKKSVWIPGGARGIGRAIALHLAKVGYEVHVCSRTSKDLEETSKLSQEKIFTDVVDISSQEEVSNWMKKTSAPPWGLIHAAGVYGPIGPLLENNLEEWEQAWKINVMGAVYTAREFSRILVSKSLPGRMVFLSGGGAEKGMSGFTSYGATKAAVVRVMETLAFELKDEKITVNAIAPGGVSTHFTDQLLSAGPEKIGAEFYKRAQEIKTGGDSPQLSADLVEYLLEESHGMITGLLISAKWDPWKTLHEKWNEIEKSETYRLRRIRP